MWTNLCVPCDTESAYLVVELQAVVGLLREEFVCVHKLVVERLDLMAEDSTSDTTNFQFLKLLQVHSCQQDFLLGLKKKGEKEKTSRLKAQKHPKNLRVLRTARYLYILR